jgi:predicted nucleotidyltransferase
VSAQTIAPDLLSTLEHYRRQLEDRFGDRLVSLRLFGSQAQGDAAEDSDADVAVVIRELTEAERQLAVRWGFDAWQRAGQRGPLPSPLVWSLAERADRIRAERRIALDIEREGIPL